MLKNFYKNVFLDCLGRSFYVIKAKTQLNILTKGSPNPFSIPSQGGYLENYWQPKSLINSSA
jgi:hypothetical protein